MSDEQDPFAGTAAAYARSRPGYGDAAIEYLVERFDLDADGRVLDLGCGAGQLAVPLAAHAGSVVAMDPNAAMREATRERAVAADHENVTVREGSDADLRAGAIDDVAPLDLTTMGRSFHWMDERPTLDCLREHTRSGGGIAIVDDVEWLTAGDEPWTAAVHAVADAFRGSGLDLVCHLPFAVDIGSPFEPVRGGSVAELIADLDLVTKLGGEKAVFHPSSRAWDLGWSEDDLRPLIFDSVREITAAAHERVSHIHLSDNRGGSDEHLPVGLGTIDFETVLAPLFDSDWAGTMTHEVGTTELAYVAESKRQFDAIAR
jgi:sugar phosphate isomerase/epimerase